MLWLNIYRKKLKSHKKHLLLVLFFRFYFHFLHFNAKEVKKHMEMITFVDYCLEIVYYIAKAILVHLIILELDKKVRQWKKEHWPALFFVAIRKWYLFWYSIYNCKLQTFAQSGYLIQGFGHCGKKAKYTISSYRLLFGNYNIFSLNLYRTENLYYYYTVSVMQIQ